MSTRVEVPAALIEELAWNHRAPIEFEGDTALLVLPDYPELTFAASVPAAGSGA